MFLSVARLSSTAVTASRRSLFINTISADSMAMSVPAPMAMPTSARARAGASLMPSPIIPTVLPPCCRARISCSLSPGNTSATTLSMPKTFLTACAVAALSPVSITTSMPSALNASTASRLAGFTLSATAIRPSKVLPQAIYSRVFPCAANLSAASRAAAVSAPVSFISRRLPAA
ncbi:MAG: hypothetical protein BWY37_02069 [Firmicutes bacterium ADurb.Bin262]|nr:MAG: hypothetical protein BWY37_02069 [Firmicutes bacterium ADurb.Bin262]